MSKEIYSLRLDKVKFSKLLQTRPIVSKHLKIYCHSSSSSGPKIAMRISKRAVKLAVIRNFLKRRLLNQFRDSMTSEKLDVLLIINKKIHSDKNEISDILMHEWKLCIKQLKKR